MKTCNRWALSMATAGSLLFGGCLQREVEESQPQTTNAFVRRLETNPIDKIDLLFVVDNSASMGDKQAIFERAIPDMLERLVRPHCVRLDGAGEVVERRPSTEPATPGGKPQCDSGWGLEFDPVDDIHVGVISSSLGGNGSEACKGPRNDDRALLMPKVREGLPDPHGTGFLVWHPPQPDDPPGTPTQDDFAQLESDFRAHITAAGEDGCGFEAPLEAWYRFLVDPSPPAGFAIEAGKIVSTGIDQDVLTQRDAFLRSDSLVAVVMLSDENDCSVKQGGPYYDFAGYGWMVAQVNGAIFGKDNMPVATSVCAENPNDACCFSCFLDELPQGCEDQSALQSCQEAGLPRLSDEADRGNVRCFDQKRRFGIDLLYPTERYIRGLSSSTIVDTQLGGETHNPLLMGAAGDAPRRPGLVFFAGVTGVPYQDIQNPELSVGDDELSYLSAARLREKVAELGGKDRWDLILGEPGKPAGRRCDSGLECGVAPVPPLDPFMIQSISPRQGENPLTGISPTAAPAWNSINGHEYDNAIAWDEIGGLDGAPAQNDLQYSCIFPLAPYSDELRICDEKDSTCDCGKELGKGSPLCRTGAGGDLGRTQHYGKAYPAPRVLEVLKGFGSNSIVASICPKVHDRTARDYGYNPAVAAIGDRLADTLKGQCLPRPLSVNPDGDAECVVIEVQRPDVGVTGCDLPGRSAIDGALANDVRDRFEREGWCVGEDCDTATFCEIVQHSEGDAREQCLNGAPGTESSMSPGYCYVDPENGLGSSALVGPCQSTERRLLRFVGQDVPLPGATTLIACAGSTITQSRSF